jgi:carbamoyltransferase
MKILGISAFYHDSAAALIKDGIPIALAEEERFTRKKHEYCFPENAIRFVLKKSNTKPEHLDFVVFYEKPFLKFERVLITSLSFFPQSYKVFRESMLAWIKEKLWIKTLIHEKLGVNRDKILFVPHHLSHAASTFLCSPFEEAAILTIDGVGEWTTTALGIGKGNKIELFKEIKFPHSLGLLYSAFTAYLGFKVNRGEYKVMGMAPYGKPIYRDKVYKLIDVKEDGSYRLNLDYFSFHISTEKTFNDKFVELFGEPRDPKMEHRFEQRHADIAASIQRVHEEVVCKIVNHLYKETKMENLCLAGGVALNSVANYKILKYTPIKSIYVQPAAGDAGGALGAAMYVYYSLLNNKRKYVMEHVFYGADYGNNVIREFLEKNDINYEEYSDSELFQLISEELDKGKVIGFFQGRFEWGPRALGNRSILADARKENMMKTVNLKIKFREGFRPFAPSVLGEDAEDLFEIPIDHYPSRFMLYVCPVRKNKRKLLSAITHVDGSARPQVVFKNDNPRYYMLLENFKEISGIGCFLNTSYNLRGEPIVNTPQEAYYSFIKSGIDMLVLGNYIVEKERADKK